MSKTFKKLIGEMLTPVEAELAENAFTPPVNYKFKHWSSSSISDNEVKELQKDGVGIVVRENLTFYPVVETFPMINMKLDGSTITYGINEVILGTHRMPNSYSEGAAIFPSDKLEEFNAHLRVNVIACPKKTTTGELILLTTSLGSLSIEGGKSGTMPYDTETAAVDFGILEFPKITVEGRTTKAWKIRSEIDGEEYVLSASFNYISIFGNVQPLFQVYKRVNGSLLKIININMMYRFIYDT